MRLFRKRKDNPVPVTDNDAVQRAKAEAEEACQALKKEKRRRPQVDRVVKDHQKIREYDYLSDAMLHLFGDQR